MNTLKILFVLLLLFAFSIKSFKNPFFLSAIQENENLVVLKEIEIPSIELLLPLKIAAVDGVSWNITDEKTAFLGEGTSFPGKDGTTVVFSHARRGYFGKLRDVSTGDLIIIRTETRQYTYRVTERRIVDPFDTSFIRHDFPHELVLITCFGTRDEKRLAVFASLNDSAMKPNKRPINVETINFMLTTKVFDDISKAYNFEQLKGYGQN